MVAPYSIQANSILVIPDIHENVSWVKSIMDKEKGNYDHIVFLGDYFDSRDPLQSCGAKQTAKFVKQALGQEFGPATLLIGNHDAPIMESWISNRKYQKKKNLLNYHTKFSNSKSQEVNKIFDWGDWLKFNLFCEFNGTVFSHAGIHPFLWDLEKTKDENLNNLYKESRTTLENICFNTPSRLLGCGHTRGGYENFGGLTWLDFSEEFVHYDIINQIVGHTRRSNTARYKGSSYCLDGGQTIYGILNHHGLKIYSTGKNHEVLDAKYGRSNY